MGYFKEKDIEQKELLERAMKIITEFDNSIWMVDEIWRGFNKCDNESREIALITFGRLYECIGKFKGGIPEIISDYRKFNDSICTLNQIDPDRKYNFIKTPHGFGKYMAQHESNHAPCYCEKPPEDWDKFLDRVKINVTKYNRPPHMEGHDIPKLEGEPKKDTPEPKKRERPAKKKTEKVKK